MLPWTDTTTLDQRRAFIAAWIAGQDSVGESLGATIPQPAPPRASARERERRLHYSITPYSALHINPSFPADARREALRHRPNRAPIDSGRELA